MTTQTTGAVARGDATTRSRTDAATPQRLTYLVKQLQEAMRAQLDEITRDFDLTPKQYTALSVLAQHPGISSAQLARITFVTTQAANEMVITLERKQNLKRAIVAENRRCLEVTLTPKGKAVLAKCNRRVERLEHQMLRDLTPRQQTEFKHTLQMCLANIS
jgi:DNA-binding MarR family transcriptional regulator